VRCAAFNLTVTNPSRPSAPIAGHTDHSHPTGNVKTDFLTTVAYLVFSDLVVPTTTLALVYGCKALLSAGCRARGQAARIANSVTRKMSHELKQKLGLDEPSVEARRRENTAMVGDWINRGKNDASIASAIRSLQQLDEPLNCQPVLKQHFNAPSIAGECMRDKMPVFQNALDFPATVIALLQSPDVRTADREKMLAALALHLPAPGSVIATELASLIDSLRAVNVSIAPGVRLLADNNPDKIAEFNQQPGLHTLLYSDEPLHVLYKVERGLRPGSGHFNEWPSGEDRVMEEQPVLPENPEAAVEDLSTTSPASSHSLEMER
jgi:hypothetical protein